MVGGSTTASAGFAASFAEGATTTERVARSLARCASKLRRPAGATVFASGGVAADLEQLAERIAELCPGLPLVVARGAGVLNQDGEHEGLSAASGVVWAGGSAEVHATPGTADEIGEALARFVADRAARLDPPVLVFAGTDGFEPDTLAPLRQRNGTRNIFGAGALGEPGAVGVDAEGALHTGPAVTLMLRGLTPPRLITSPACKLLGPLRPITGHRGSMVLEIGGEPALDVLTALGAELADQPLVFAVLAREEEPNESGRPEVIIRGVQGVDPVRRGLVVTNEVREGMRITFAIRDATAAREDLQSGVRQLKRDIAGSAPRFGLYLNCAGRGSGLYGVRDVDVRIIAGEFPGVPFAGMHSAFEIAPHDGDPAMQLYTGVFALFAAPS